MDAQFERLLRQLPQRYSVEHELARGGMATVFLATESQPSRRVAIKVFDPLVSAHLGRERFLREVDLASKLTHPHIIPIFAAGGTGDLLYYVMPYVEGESLRARIEREGQLPIQAALEIAADVADALDYAHRRRIVHRDIKPENILLHEGHAFVADFGIARAVDVAGAAKLVTAEGRSVGTPTYMSPEQIRGSDTDARADVYSLACVLYETLAGEPPFLGKTAQAVMQRHLAEPPPQLRHVRDSVPPTVEAAIIRALAKVPSDRFDSATSFLRALDATSLLDTRSLPTTRLAGSGVPALRLRARVVIPVALVLAALSLIGLLARRPRASRALTRRSYAASAAVLAVRNLTGRRDLDPLALSLTDEIITSLQRVRGLNVISWNSVVALQGSHLTTPQIAETLGVSYIIEGSLRLRGDSATLGMRLLDSADTRLWNSELDSPLSDMTRAGDSIGDLVMNGLLASVPRLKRPQPGPRGEHSPGHAAYVAGMSALGLRTAAGFKAAIVAFDSARRLDPSFAGAYAQLSKAYGLTLFYHYDLGVSEYRVAALALSLAERAIAIDSSLAAGWEARAYIGSRSGAPMADVQQDFERARRLDPSAVDAAIWSAYLLGEQGRHDSAMTLVEGAIALDPLSAPRQLSMAYEALAARKYDTALRAARRARALAPALLQARVIEARLLVLMNRADECLGLDLGPNAATQAMCLLATGHQAQAEALVDSVEQAVRAGRLHDPIYSEALRIEDLACYYAWRGRGDDAGRWVREAFRRSPLGIEHRTVHSALFDRVRDQPWFTGMTEGTRGWSRVVAQKARAD